MGHVECMLVAALEDSWREPEGAMQRVERSKGVMTKLLIIDQFFCILLLLSVSFLILIK